MQLRKPPVTFADRRGALLLASALGVAGLSWISGPGSFDFIDGSEFVICGRALQLSHPPGYPLYIFSLRSFSLFAPCAVLDYSCFRIFSSLVAAGAAIAAWAAARSFRCTWKGSVAGALLIMTSGAVMGQMNLVEVHGFAIMLVLWAVALRSSTAGPYLYSLSLFGGHPVSLFLLPSALSGRYRQRWVLMAVLPPALLLFIPLRSAFGALSHYSSPGSASAVFRYLTLYGSRMSAPTTRGLEALASETGVLSLAAMALLAMCSRRWSWKLFLSIAGGLLFVSSYSIPDTASLLWIVVLPLGLWAAIGLSRLLEGGTPGRASAALLLVAAAVSGVSASWRRGDDFASVAASDYLRGAGPEAAFVTTGMSTFHTAYLLEVMDRRPDILPMDTHRCFFRIHPPAVLPPTLGGRPVYATRGWEFRELGLSGLLFTADPVPPPDWERFDVFSYSGKVHDGFARDEMAEMWARRGVQEISRDAREMCRKRAMEWAETDITRERTVNIFEMY